MTFKAKIKDKDEFVEGNACARDYSTGDWVIGVDAEWVDGGEWNMRDFEFIDITTLEIIK